jgi:signal transduction histidine kinase
MAVNDKLKSSSFISFITLIVITIIQSFFLILYLNSLTIELLTNQIAFIIITFLLINSSGYVLVQIYRKKREKEKIKQIQESEKIKIEELNYLTELDKFKNKLLSMNQISKISEETNFYFTKVFKFSHSLLFLWNEEIGAFIPHPDEESIDLKYYIFDPFLLWLTDYDKIFSFKDFELNSEFNKIKSEAIRFLSASNSEKILPLNLNQSLIGFILLGRKNSEDDFQNKEISRLNEIKSTIIISLSNAIFYAKTIALTENLENKVKERTKALEEAQSQLVMSEKMASLGVMVAGIAHEINTPVGVINGASDNMDSSIHYILKHLPDSKDYFIQKESLIIFEKIIQTLLESQNKISLEPKDKFKKKKELREKFSSNGIDSRLTDDLTNFLVEKNLLHLEKEILELIQLSSPDVLEFLNHAYNLNSNLKNIKFGIKNIVRIVKALKYYSHLDQASFSEANLIEGIENILIILHNQLKHGIEVITNFTEIPLIPCNLDELNQVWTNIIQNAIHAMKGKGILRISTYTEDQYVALEIADTGSGIPSEIIDRIWDPFFTTKDQGEGSGLGLGIVKNIIEKHKGKILVKSKPGETIFKILLPYTKE